MHFATSRLAPASPAQAQVRLSAVSNERIEMDPARTTEATVGTRTLCNCIYCADSRRLDMIEDGVVDLVICSPPYNVGKNYKNHNDALPLDEYLALLRDVWVECKRVMRPGARICVNVAGVDRQPYLPLQSFITLQLRDLGFLMRGQIIWDKAASVGVSTAWGSWQRPSNPTLRDIHEYIIVFCKDQFRLEQPKGETDLTSEEFTQLTKSIWTFPTGSARKVGHPAPFPVELPARSGSTPGKAPSCSIRSAAPGQLASPPASWTASGSALTSTRITWRLRRRGWRRRVKPRQLCSRSRRRRSGCGGGGAGGSRLLRWARPPLGRRFCTRQWIRHVGQERVSCPRPGPTPANSVQG